MEAERQRAEGGTAQIFAVQMQLTQDTVWVRETQQTDLRGEPVRRVRTLVCV